MGTENHTASVLTGAFAAIGFEVEINSGASAAAAQRNEQDKCSTPLSPAASDSRTSLWTPRPISCWCNCESLGSCHMLVEQMKLLRKGKSSL